jgi:hypothetical protein
LKRHIDALLADYPENRAVELANKILRDLDELDNIEESYTIQRLNGRHNVRKNESVAERVKAKVRSVAGLK